MLCLIQRFLAPTPKLVIGKQDPTEGNTGGEQMNIHEEHLQHYFYDLLFIWTMLSLRPEI
ncbi:hypothetical protein D3C81_678790 [compost metagenome]